MEESFRGEGDVVFAARAAHQSIQRRTAGMPTPLPCTTGTLPCARISLMAGWMPPEILETTMTGAHGDGGAGHVRELLHLFGGHVAGDVLRDDERFHILLGGEDAEAGGVGLAQIAAAPRVEGVGDGGVGREHFAEPFLPGL